METREVFDAAPLSVAQFLGDTGLGLYIPPYQRNYSWELAKVRRLVDDIANGLNQMLTMEDSICFIGTVIALKDSNYITVEPVYRQQVPSKVMTIIDGQQRVTTLVILATLLHEEIRTRSDRLQGSAGGAETWLLNQSQDVIGRLATTYQEDMRWGSGDLQWYPRVIRAYYDVWSRNEGEGNYSSPIGHYLFQYAIYARHTEPKVPFKLPAPGQQGENGGDEPNAEGHAHLARIRAQVRTLLRRLANRDVPDDDDVASSGESSLPGGQELADTPALQIGLFNSPLSEDVKQTLADPKLQQLCRLVILANYLLLRVTVAVVTAKREEYGFDMFEALNTTGEPLTAIETFKPKVIQAEGLQKWKASPSKSSFDRVDAFLDRTGSTTSTDKRQIATSSLLIPFALAQSGRKLGKRLNEQRGYLRTSYEEQPDLDSKRRYMTTLAQLVSFVDGPWATPGEAVEVADGELGQQAALALAALKGGNHEIVLAPLSRYYGAYRLASSEDGERVARRTEFLKAAVTCVGFYGLWRGGQGGTSGIDDVWRTAMQGDDAMPPIARKTRSLTDVPSVALLRKYLAGRLASKGLLEKATWVRRASTVAVGQYTSLTRLLLLAASDDAVPDDTMKGLIVRGRPGVAPTLNLAAWNDDALLTVEHIAPQSPKEGDWDRSIYDVADTYNRLGNLTLLPRQENASIGNRNWQLKRLLYRTYSSDTLDEADKVLAEAAKEGLRISDSSNDIVQRSRYLPLVKALTQRAGEWDAAFISGRSERIAELAYDKLISWIGGIA